LGGATTVGGKWRKEKWNGRHVCCADISLSNEIGAEKGIKRGEKEIMRKASLERAGGTKHPAGLSKNSEGKENGHPKSFINIGK